MAFWLELKRWVTEPNYIGFCIPPTCGRYTDGFDILSPKQEKKRCAREFRNTLYSNNIEPRSTKTVIILLKMAMILIHVKWERCNVIVKWERCNKYFLQQRGISKPSILWLLWILKDYSLPTLETSFKLIKMYIESKFEHTCINCSDIVV